MKPPQFAYADPATVEEAVAILADYGDRAKVLAGGQSLIPLMNMRLARPELLVDIAKLRDLDGLEAANGALSIGALTRQSDVADSPEVARDTPIVAEALRHVGHPATRNRGTLGGTIAHADPAAELPAVLVALGGEVVARGPRGERTIAADDLFRSYFTTALEDDELLTAVRIPRGGESSRWWFGEIARRHGDFALVGVAASARVDPGGACAEARLVVFGAGSTPIRMREAEERLNGRPLGDEAVAAEAAAAAAAALSPSSDVHATGEYRREVAGVLVRRAALGMAA